MEWSGVHVLEIVFMWPELCLWRTVVELKIRKIA